MRQFVLLILLLSIFFNSPTSQCSIVLNENICHLIYQLPEMIIILPETSILYSLHQEVIQGNKVISTAMLTKVQEELEELIKNQHTKRAPDGYLVQFSTALAALGLGVNLATNPSVVQVINVGNGAGPTQTTIGNTNAASFVTLVGNVNQPLDGVTQTSANYRIFYDIITLDGAGSGFFNANGTDFAIDTILAFSLTYNAPAVGVSALAGQIVDGVVGTDNALAIAGDLNADVMVMAFCITN